MPSPPPDFAPLLSKHDAATISDDSSPPTNALASRLHRYAKIIRVSGLILSIFMIIMIIAILILFKFAPFSTWGRDNTDGAVMGWYIASAITAIIVLCIPLPALLSFSSDVVFLVGTIVCSVWWITLMPLNEYHGRGYKVAINIIMGFVAAFGILLATSYALLLLIRVYNVFKFKVWRSKLPGSGEITWTVSLNVLTDGHERTYGFSVGAKADSKATEGAVHL